MSTWLYQINQEHWSPNRYRLDIWEGQVAQWTFGGRLTPQKISSKRKQQISEPDRGDIVVFFYAKSGGDEPGFYGWAVITDWLTEHKEMNFQPASPSDHLKMDPWWNKNAESLANNIRGGMKQGTLFFVNDDDAKCIRHGIAGWLSRRSTRNTSG